MICNSCPRKCNIDRDNNSAIIYGSLILFIAKNVILVIIDDNINNSYLDK